MTKYTYTDAKVFFEGELKRIIEEYKDAKLDSTKLDTMQSIANVLTLMGQIETLINAEKVNSKE